MADSARIEDLRKRYHENPRRFFAPLANEYRKSGFLDRAILLCEKHLAEQPDNMNGLVVYGQTLFESGRQDDAREPFERALQLDPENLIALRQLGDIARIGGDVATAKGWYDKVLEFDRRNDEVLELLEQMGVGEPKEPVSAPRPSTTAPLVSVAPTVSVSGGEGLDIGLVDLDAPKAPVAGPGKTKVINAQRLADTDREQVEAAGAETLRMEAVIPTEAPSAPPPAKAPSRRASLLDISFDFSEIAETPAPAPMPEAPLMGAEAAEYGFADIAPETPTVPIPAPAPVEPRATAAESADAGLDGLELAEFSSDVSPLAGLEATEFTSEVVAPLADLDLPDVQVEDVAPLAGLDLPDVQVEDVAPLAGLDRPEFEPEEVKPLADLDAPEFVAEEVGPLSGLESVAMESEPTGQMTAGLPMLGDTPVEPPMAVPPLTVADVPSLADTLPMMQSPWRETPSQEPPLEPATQPSASRRPRMTRADLASLPLLADYGLDDDEAVRRGTPLSTPAIPEPTPAAAEAEPEPRASQKTPTFVTETMATLYLQQGFRDKAIDVYRQLVEQAPNDAALQAKLAELESSAPEMPEFEAPSEESLEPEPAPANAVLADVSFADVGLTTPRPSSSRTPLATPAVASGPTAREFFAAFARRGLVAAAAVASVTASLPAAEEPSAALVEEQASAAGTGWPLDALFGAASEVRDLHAAEVLAGLATFTGPTGGTGLDQLFAEPAAPSIARRTVSRASQMLKFDQFFSATPASSQEVPVEPEPVIELASAPEPPAADPGDDDLDQFHGWLQALKP